MRFNSMVRYVVAVSLLLSSCKPTLDDPKVNRGTADFSRYVSLGGGLTSGYSDAALSYDGQQCSFPYLLSTRFKLAGGGAFLQPYVNPGNGLSINPLTHAISGKLKLTSFVNCAGSSDFTATATAGNPADMQWIGNLGPYNNLGVPVARSYNLYSQYFGKPGPSGYPYYYRFASDTGGASGLSSTILGDAAKINPTFFTLWVGSSDVIQYALNGGLGSTSGMSTYDITPVDTFNKAIDIIVNNLVANGAKGVIANIPEITNIPYFTTIPYNGLVLNATQAAQLNAISPPGISFTAGANPFVIKEGGTIRQLVPGELILMNVPADSMRCYGLGTTLFPIDSKYTLNLTQVENVKNATTLFNAKLRAVATDKQLAFADLNAFYKTIYSGIVFNGVTYTGQFIAGGAFSLDGINPNAHGYALIANEFIRTINAKYKSNLPEVDVNNYKGIVFP
jgi:hypothetical protein